MFTFAFLKNESVVSKCHSSSLEAVKVTQHHQLSLCAKNKPPHSKQLLFYYLKKNTGSLLLFHLL